MERGTKRKAAALGTPTTPQHLQTPTADRPAKRIRTPLAPETKAPPAKSVQNEARDFIEHLKRATDKNGRLVSTVFLELPHPDELPDYYDLINLPISVATLEAKIERNEYANLSDLEGDVKRMVANAKKYNESKSEIYDDAERIRKLTFNYMTRMNPAYKSGNYTAVATPEPAQPQGYPGGATARRPGAKPATVPTPTPKHRDPSRSVSVAVAAPTVAADDSNFIGKTLKEAQEIILRDAIAFTVDNLEIFTPFVNLPPRSLTEYYAQIKQPTSLKGTLKKVHGIHGRNEATGVTDFKTWDAFEAEVAKIWHNCRDFNEDGSDMYNLAQTFEDWFHERIGQARAAIPDPAAPTLKLNLTKSNATNIKLRLGQKESPAPATVKSASPVVQRPGISIDHQALQRQRAAVDEAVHGRPASRHSLPQTQGAGRHTSPPMPGTGLKREAGGINGTYKPAMPPPSATNAPRLTNGATGYNPSGMLQQQQAHNPYQNFTQPPTGIDSKWRADGKGPEEAIMVRLHVGSAPTRPAAANPNMPNVPSTVAAAPAKPLNYTFAAHPQLSQQSFTLNVPAYQQTLFLSPKLNPSLTSGSREYRVWVHVNGVPATLASVGGNLRYEAKCMPGVNRVEVQVAAPKQQRKEPTPSTGSAASAAGSAGEINGTSAGDAEPTDDAHSAQHAQQVSKKSTGPAQELELEKVSLFVHVMRP